MQLRHRASCVALALRAHLANTKGAHLTAAAGIGTFWPDRHCDTNDVPLAIAQALTRGSSCGPDHDTEVAIPETAQYCSPLTTGVISGFGLGLIRGRCLKISRGFCHLCQHRLARLGSVNMRREVFTSAHSIALGNRDGGMWQNRQHAQLTSSCPCSGLPSPSSRLAYAAPCEHRTDTKTPPVRNTRSRTGR